MSYAAEEFRTFFVRTGAKETSATYYLSYLKKIDQALRESERGGIDEAIKTNLIELKNWAKTTHAAPFDQKPSNPRSVLNKYLMFKESLGEVELEKPDSEFEEDNPLEPTGQAFHLERDMQAAVRRQIESLEPGLKIVDDNFERRVSTGEIDITAKDKDGGFVIIELKAGDCPKGALEQLMGYANDIRIEEEVEKVRLVLIAKSFSDRIVGAATFVPNLQLVTYDYTLSFRAVG